MKAPRTIVRDLRLKRSAAETRAPRRLRAARSLRAERLGGHSGTLAQASAPGRAATVAVIPSAVCAKLWFVARTSHSILPSLRAVHGGRPWAVFVSHAQRRTAATTPKQSPGAACGKRRLLLAAAQRLPGSRRGSHDFRLFRVSEAVGATRGSGGERASRLVPQHGRHVEKRVLAASHKPVPSYSESVSGQIIRPSSCSSSSENLLSHHRRSFACCRSDSFGRRQSRQTGSRPSRR